ncbi:Ger(x)C family spore germination protein [Hazenella sp. IB182357]|uniref:Ger(X)C family spore germination protein n=1 Tax=Polycladospora coralii TaxID=2771432 RepID=A0A926N5D8_9BACL|nr:Ger(x)C family spore germination protein [Polycladospora coralii]MBD1370766.1 Ger(x)C family spore germination protein [Polycladospora coralii]MBS7529704.1 Ger(x)C family spore germination protein [Polycladospora coralii]
MKYLQIMFILILLLWTTGCDDFLLIEEVDTIIVFGLDTSDKEGAFTFFEASPVFSETADKKYNIKKAVAHSAREARNILNAQATGHTVGGKIQLVILGKNLLKEKNIYPHLDVLFRDPKNEINARMLVVDGDVDQFLGADMKDKGRIGIVIPDIMRTTHRVGGTVDTLLLDYHRQMMDKRVTPSMSEMTKMEDELIVTGTALLNREGLYAQSINRRESSLLLMLQRQTNNPLSLDFRLPEDFVKAENERTEMSINIDNINYETQVNCDQENFELMIDMDIKGDITQKLFYFDMENRKQDFEKQLDKQLAEDFEKLIAKFQQDELDPAGFGRYAKAYCYPQWKKIKNDWPKDFAKSKVTIRPHIEIRDYGVQY